MKHQLESRRIPEDEKEVFRLEVMDGETVLRNAEILQDVSSSTTDWAGRSSTNHKSDQSTNRQGVFPGLQIIVTWEDTKPRRRLPRGMANGLWAGRLQLDDQGWIRTLLHFLFSKACIFYF